MSTAPKLAQRRQHTGEFGVDQQQRLAQDTARKVNSQADTLSALTNRSYATLAANTTLATSASYATLLTANITTVLATGYLLVHFTASGIHTNGGATVYFQVTVDGVATRGSYVTVPTANYAWSQAIVARVAVTRGGHAVLLQWRTDNNSARINAATVVTEHADLLVQEAAA